MPYFLDFFSLKYKVSIRGKFTGEIYSYDLLDEVTTPAMNLVVNVMTAISHFLEIYVHSDKPICNLVTLILQRMPDSIAQSICLMVTLVV